MNKLILQTLNETGEIISTKEYKSLKAIGIELNIEYFALRSVWLLCQGKKVRNLHPYNDMLQKKYKIVNNYPDV
jgi:hypothetical protein